MAVEGGLKCVKFLLFFFNCLFWICGIALIVVGVMVQIALHNGVTIDDAAASAAPIAIIVVGVIIFFIAFFGCCGAWKENYCMISMFAILLTIIIIIEIAAAIAGYIFKGKVKGYIDVTLEDMISKYKSSEPIRKTVDKMQQDLECCGANKTSDWKDFKKEGNSVPDSCCKNMTKDCGVNNMNKPKIVFQQPCGIIVDELLEKNLVWVIVAALVIAFLQIVGLVFACLLMKGIRSGYEVM